MNPSIQQPPTVLRPNCAMGSDYLHAHNVARMNSKNPHAVALGSMTSGAKAAAAEKNGKKGGRPAGS